MELDFDEQVEAFANRAQQHGLDEAIAYFQERAPENAEEVIGEFMRRVGEPLAVQVGLVDDGIEPWYMPLAEKDSPRWAFAKTQLGLDDAAVAEVSRVADEILARIGNPMSSQITTRGLVVGHVQSGKTTSFLSVAAKALDNRYDLVIVLSGVHNSLRRQTQDRAYRTLVHNPGLWWVGTRLTDFKPDGNSLSAHLAGNGKRGLLVVKKHKTILKRLADWLEAESDTSLRKKAILVIDDEADQAGLNVARGDELEGIHKQLSRLVNLQTSTGERRCAYLAYTATPYANILTSQEKYGLYPRSFIYPLEPPTNYVGIDQLFGDEQVGRPIQLELNDRTQDVLTEALKDSVRWFVLATAARVGLGKPLGTFNSSMLIHTTQSTQDQIKLRPIIEKYLDELRQECSVNTLPMQSFYEKVLPLVPSQVGGGDGFLDERTASWDEVRGNVLPVLEHLINRVPAGEPFMEDLRLQQAKSGVIVDNSKVGWIDRLTYPDTSSGQPGVVVIAIGGNTLSRGLTLEGLVCSYFARTSRTYDSLMQMGRWFGYRPGYRHLVRIWTTPTLLTWFRELNEVEERLRYELKWMQEHGYSPAEYGPRIMVSPYMNICRAAAMRSVRREVTYSDSRIEPAWVLVDQSDIDANELTISSLVRACQGGEKIGPGSQSTLFREVPLAAIRGFLQNFQLHPEETRFDKPSFHAYLEKEQANLSHWNVVFRSNTAQESEYDYGGEVGVVRTIRRSKYEDTFAYIKSLVDSGDHRIDVSSPHPDEANYRASSEPPLLIIYALDKTGSPDRRSRDKVALCADATTFSFSIAMPKSKTFVEYVAPAIREIEEAIENLDIGSYQDGE